jgi:septal ring factor EnvC (AmiA/AmiB activator)
MRWQGVTIAADAGTEVRAIHPGRVVYADWLRGSGLLLVLDHGEGYMSLYAHNQTLLRTVGDWVNAGTPISTMGASGGREQAALYFEIREQGTPVDPAQWCSG